MAENKKSFVIYADIIHTLEKMPDDKAGLLFKHILRYVNDQEPETDDLIVQLCFEPIKQQLKRDLKIWEGNKAERSISGKLGGIKSGEARRKTKLIEANEANASITKQNEANEAVTVNVTVDDNVIKEKINKKDFVKTNWNTSPISETFGLLPEKKIKASQEIVFLTSRVRVIDEDIGRLWEVFKIQNLTGKNYYANEDKVYSHFINWIKTQKFDNRKSVTNRQANADALTRFAAKAKLRFEQAQQSGSIIN